MIERYCPTCRRPVVIENNRFTAHTDGRRWHEKGPLEQCPMAGKLVVPSRPSPPNE